ncbi:MAG TPA: HEAT repeat domain-containing protein [Polyangiaceae bacterium]|jgi:hypothetical protein|nr:HEAT repeat domain-containing protein [Polyangiaceae bacterium]
MRRLGALALVGLACSVASASRAEGARPGAPSEPRSLRGFVGIGAARPLLRADASATRERAFERLGSAGTARALELLARALDNGGAARDARERLTVVRALARHAKDPTAQDALIRALGGVEDHAEEPDQLVERTAALALAASRDPLALAALARALRQPGRVSEAARLALTVHRPRRIEPLLEATGAPTPALVRLLGVLGDARAVTLLEHLAAKGTPALAAPALEALAALDPARATPLAQAAIDRERDARVRVAAVRTLVFAHADGTERAFQALLTDPVTQARALALALEAPGPALGPTLSRAQVTDDQRDRLFAALGRAGGSPALSRLEHELARPENTWSAAYALAQSPDAEADTILERALDKPAERRDAARAATARFAAQGRRVTGLERALKVLEQGSVADRAAAAWCRAVLEPDQAGKTLASGDAIRVRAVARQAFTPELAPFAAARLERERAPELQSALAIALAVPAAAELVSTRTLVELLERRGPEGYLVAYALALRDGPALRPRLRELLASEDSTLRAHTALGLAASSEPGVVGLLAEAYRSEVEPRVRLALVRALATRAEPARLATLELAATLEPDDATREEAAGALEKERASTLPRSTPAAPAPATAWLKLEQPESGAVPSGVLETSRGLALPCAADPDGSITVAFLPPGDVSVWLVAPEAESPKGAHP